jgi:TolB-like protein
MKDFFAELQRRNVYKVAVAYAVVAWLLIQIATQVFPFFEIPNWGIRLVVLLIVSGFPVALILAWAFELTPEGIKRTEDVKPKGPSRSRAWIYITMLAGAISLALFFLGRYSAPGKEQTPAEAPLKSIAVLPFDNLSPDRDNAYFADGIQEEILTRLAGFGDLKVISKTSTAQYKSKPEDLKTVGHELGVGSVLEGSVQKANDEVRVNVQLIDARLDTHLWADSYDRKLADILGVESEVAGKIAESLRVKLSSSEQRTLEAKPTDNAGAYDAYLRGLEYERRSALSPETFQNASRFYREAVQFDPNFALAWAHLAIRDSDVYFEGFDRTSTRLTEAQEAAEKARKLQPDLGEGYLAEGFYNYDCLRDYPAARRAFSEARRRLPNNSDVIIALTYVDRREGRWQEALAHQAEATKLDPRNAQSFFNSGLTYLWLGNFSEARAMLERGLLLTPDDAELAATKAASYQAEGNLNAAQKVLDTVQLQPDDNTVFDTQMLQLLFERRYKPAIEALNLALSNPAPALGESIADYYVLLGLAQERSGDTAGAHATYAEGRAKAETLLKNQARSTFLSADLALLYAGLRDKPAALRETQELARLSANDAVTAPAAVEVRAQVYAQFGDADAVVAALPALLRAPCAGFLTNAPLTAGLLRLDPMWDPVRNDPRFQKLAVSPAPNKTK